MTSVSSTPSTAHLADTLQRLRQCNQLDIQSRWHWHSGDLSPQQVFSVGKSCPWPVASLNDRQHIAWEKGQQVLWLYQSITVPETLQGYPLQDLTLRFSLAWWAEEAQIYVDGQLRQAGDLFDYFTRLCLEPHVTPGQTFTLALRLVSPGHDDGALVRSQLLYEVPPDSDLPSPEPSFIADELEVLQHYAQALAPEKVSEIEAALGKINWSILDLSTSPPPSLPTSQFHFHQSLFALRQHLLPLSTWIKQHHIHCLGHAHLDLAWLWPVEDTWRAAERTFESVLHLQEDFPELTYTHSSPALFAWLEQHRPALFRTIQEKVRAGTWSIDAGLWVEPELNIISGESIARQILYGQRYCQEKFGQLSTIAWLPDTFGFCAQLPQLLKLGGIEVFATQKLRWNDTTEFPHELFTWQAPDGSQVLGWTLPPIGTDFDPVAIAKYATQWETKTGILHAFWLPGIGDHGGGPTRDMLEKARRWSQSPFFPQVHFTSAREFLDTIIQGASPSIPDQSHPYCTGQPQGHAPTSSPPISASGRHKASPYPPLPNSPLGMTPLRSVNTHYPLPLWQTELYLELHRGCYTTHADQKQHNRRSEDLLYQAELWATIAQLIAHQPYPKADLETAWKTLLFNQFHDILPGSSIPQVFIDANQDWAQVTAIGTRILADSLDAIAQVLSDQFAAQIHLIARPHPEAQAIFVFNALNWSRTEIVTLPLPTTAPDASTISWQVYDLENQPISSQPHSQNLGESASTLTFLAQDIPSVGYRGYWLCPTQSISSAIPDAPLNSSYILANQFLQVTLDADTGDIISLLDLKHQREVLAGPGNQLQAFRDQGQYWDAWNIAPDYADHPLLPATLTDLQWIEQSPLRQRLRVTRRLNQSTITQEYCLDAHSPLLKIETWIDWQETQVLLKVNFPLALDADHATYETPFGAIAHPTRPQTEHEKAKWEVPALRWADLSDGTYGFSLLTDCKHGFDASPHRLRLTLLKSPLWPDPNADRGRHHFTYTLYPHSGTWQTAQTVHHAHALNIPLQAVIAPSPAANFQSEPIYSARSFLTLNPENLILSAFKPAEDDPHQFMLRCYEAHGTHAASSLKNILDLKTVAIADLLEQNLDHSTDSIQPHQVITFRLQT